MNRTHCSFCGKTLATRRVAGRTRQVCAVCGRVHYENPLPVASILIANQAHDVLLVKRANEPYKGMWCLPIGFAELGESIQEAALRELEEEAGIRAEVRGLLDVSSHANPHYGDMLIVTFEGRKLGGLERAGDDAEEARYFAISHLPKLAFAAQERAVKTYLALHDEEWAIRSSMEAFVLAMRRGRQAGEEYLESDVLLAFVSGDPGPILDHWLEDVTTHPSTPHYHRAGPEELRRRATRVIELLAAWAHGRVPAETLQERVAQLGRERRAEGYALSEVLSAFSLLKKHIWTAQVSGGFWEHSIEIYRVLELDKRITLFFDLLSYHLTRGWEAASGTGAP